MSKTDIFVNKYTGKVVDVKPGWGYPGECVSLVQRFIIEELGVVAKPRGNGEAWRYTLINEGLGHRVPREEMRKGDIISWPGRYGHVAISLGGDLIFEQEGPSIGGSGVAKVGSASYWDRKLGDGLVTRLLNFDDSSKDTSGLDHPTKTDDQLVQEVEKGLHGNGSDRVASLGNRYDAVQKILNAKYAKKDPVPKKPDFNKLAADIWLGKYGNGMETRSKKLKAEYPMLTDKDVKDIQALVSKGVGKPTTTPKPEPVVTFKPYSHTIKAGATLYEKDGTPFSLKMKANTPVTIIEEYKGLGRFKATWLKGVSEAWTKIGSSIPTPPTTSPKPKTQYANMEGMTGLYVSSSGSNTYPAPSTHKKTSLAKRSAVILDTKGTRVKVNIPKFNPSTVWLEKSQITITTSPKYKINP